MTVEFIVMKNTSNPFFILGNEWMTAFGIDITNSKSNYFTIGNEFKKEKFALMSKAEALAPPKEIFLLENTIEMNSFRK